MANPVAGGTVGRTDQGVDISGSPGAAVTDPIPGVSQLVGIIRNWYHGQPYEWFRVLTGKFKGRYWYGAEQIKFSITRIGQKVSGGQRIGTIAQSGTGTEFGYATASGQTEAAATTGYTEGQVTQSGLAFGQQVIRDRSSVTSPSSTSSRTRPGGTPPDTGQDVETVLTAYQDEITTPRVAPANAFVSTSGSPLLAPFSYWWQSFTDRWAADIAPDLGGGSGKSSTNSTPSGPVPRGSHGVVTTALLQQIGSKHGWSGQQIADWMNVIKAESNGTLTDTNPSSGAYGLAQFIKGASQYYSYGGNPNTVEGQLTAMANYISQRYGNPSAAWAHEQSMNWY